MKRKRRALKALTFEKAFEGYEALEHPDGTFTIQNFPIFGEVAADSNGNKIAATPEWLRAALDRSLKLQAEGFAGPAHVGHHGNWDALGQAADERERVGALVLRDLRPYRVEGKVEQTIFADLAEVSAEKFSRIQKGELPHVSVEYIEEHRPAIDSLAMTGSACPFKRYPNMKISKVTKAPKPTCYTVVAPAPPASAATFFEVPEKKGDPKDEKKSAPPATENAGNQDAQKQPPAGDPSTGGQQAGQQDGSQNAQDAAVGTAPPWAQAIVNGYGAMLQTIQAIAIKLGATLTPGALSGPVTLPPTPVSPVINTGKSPDTRW